MHRRIARPVFAAVSLAALTGSLIRPAAAQEPSPGTIVTVAGTGKAGFSGDGGPANQARLNWPSSVAVDAAGNVFIAEFENGRLRKVSPDGMISSLAGLGAPNYLALDQEGNLFVSDFYGNRVRKMTPQGVITIVAGNGKVGFSGDGGPALEASFDGAEGLAVDAAGNLFIADGRNQRVRKVSPDGLITTIAGSGPTGDDKGKSTGDGGPATEARLMGPQGLALDRSGNLFVSEQGNWGGYRVRKVSAAGIITTVAGSDRRGFFGDGGPATEARLNVPFGLAVDSVGNLFIADWGNYRVRKVDPNGIITTVAGIGNQRSAEGSVLATETGLRGPFGLAVDRFGNLLITDSAVNHSGASERVFQVFGVAAPGLIAGELFPSP